MPATVYNRTRRVATTRQSRNAKNYINRLPTELLAGIFVLLYTSARDQYKLSSYFKAAVLSVCRHWRAIVMSTPALWTEISIAPSKGPWTLDHLLKRLNTIVPRAGILPIHVIWDQPPSVGNRVFAKLVGRLFQLAPAYRWKELTVRNNRPVTPRPDAQPFTSLQRLALSELKSTHYILSLLELSRATPSYVKIDGLIDRSIMSPVAPIFESTTDLQISRNSEGRIHRFFPNVRKLRIENLKLYRQLASCSHLTELRVLYADMRDLALLSASRVELIWVDTLTYSAYRDSFTLSTVKNLQALSGCLWSLASLGAPNLEKLTLGNKRDTLERGNAIMSHVLQHSQYSWSPTTATLYMPMEIATFSRFLCRSERLQHVSFVLDKHACSNVDELVDVFSRTHGEGNNANFVCPNLRTIRLVLRWNKAGSKLEKVGLERFPLVVWREVADSILAVRLGTPLTSVKYEWEDEHLMVDDYE